MKLGRLRTLRGQIVVTGGGTAKANLVVSDGLVNLGLRIKSFTVWKDQTPINATASLTAILSLDTIIAGSNMDAGDNRQFAWHQSSSSGTVGQVYPPTSIIDPDHIVNRDLFLTLDNTTSGTYNYLIEAQVVELSDDEAIITIIKETSQS